MLDTGHETGGHPSNARYRPAPDRGHGPPDPACDLVTVPARQGLEAVDILRLRDGIGPVLHNDTGDVLGFLVPPGTAERWDLPGSACAPAEGHHRRSPCHHGPQPFPLAVPHGTVLCGPASHCSAAPERSAVAPAEPLIMGAGWLVPPEGACSTATEPTQLRAALGEAARTIAAADSCR